MPPVSPARVSTLCTHVAVKLCRLMLPSPVSCILYNSSKFTGPNPHPKCWHLARSRDEHEREREREHTGGCPWTSACRCACPAWCWGWCEQRCPRVRAQFMHTRCDFAEPGTHLATTFTTTAPSHTSRVCALAHPTALALRTHSRTTYNGPIMLITGTVARHNSLRVCFYRWLPSSQ